MKAELIAGMLAGGVGLLVFLLIHHFWIKPIWFILPPGLVIAALGGLAIGWSYAEIRAGLPPRPWSFLAITALIALILAPGIILAEFRPSLIDMTTFTIAAGQGGRAVRVFIFELIMPAMIIGGALGWFLGHTRTAAISTSLAGIVFALGPGHNIPFLGGTPAVGKGILLLLAIVLVSALVLVESTAILSKPLSQ